VIDVILCDSDDFSLSIQNEIALRREPVGGAKDILHPVMVFFDSAETLHNFYDSMGSEAKQIWKVRTVTQDVPPSEKASHFLKATQKGSVTLMIREYGRGTDFKCYDQRMLDAGGVHVIQSFFSSDFSEEIQIRGRTARQGAKGSYRYEHIFSHDSPSS
jgi:preprotein translocase subunit SecA